MKVYVLHVVDPYEPGYGWVEGVFASREKARKDAVSEGLASYEAGRFRLKSGCSIEEMEVQE